MFLYLDESGDLGFDFSKGGTSKFFTITILVCHNRESVVALKKAVNITIKRKLRNKKKDKKQYELKGSQTDLSIKEYFFNKITNDEFSIFSITLDKRDILKDPTSSISKPHRIYNLLTKKLVEKISFANNKRNRVDFILDKCKNSAQREDFNIFIKAYLETRLSLNVDTKFYHQLSHEIEVLQATDLFCWGISRKIINNQYYWYDIFKEKILFEEVVLYKDIE